MRYQRADSGRLTAISCRPTEKPVVTPRRVCRFPDAAALDHSRTVRLGDTSLSRERQQAAHQSPKSLPRRCTAHPLTPLAFERTGVGLHLAHQCLVLAIRRSRISCRTALTGRVMSLWAARPTPTSQGPSTNSCAPQTTDQRPRAHLTCDCMPRHTRCHRVGRRCSGPLQDALLALRTSQQLGRARHVILDLTGH